MKEILIAERELRNTLQQSSEDSKQKLVMFLEMLSLIHNASDGKLFVKALEFFIYKQENPGAFPELDTKKEP